MIPLQIPWPLGCQVKGSLQAVGAGGQGALDRALEWVEAPRAQPNDCRSAGDRHWSIFTRLCREGEARGDLVPDAYLAALAIESGIQLVTTDRDFARFAELDWRAPPP